MDHISHPAFLTSKDILLPPFYFSIFQCSPDMFLDGVDVILRFKKSSSVDQILASKIAKATSPALY